MGINEEALQRAQERLRQARLNATEAKKSGDKTKQYIADEELHTEEHRSSIYKKLFGK